MRTKIRLTSSDERNKDESEDNGKNEKMRMVTMVNDESDKDEADVIDRSNV